MLVGGLLQWPVGPAPLVLASVVGVAMGVVCDTPMAAGLAWARPSVPLMPAGPNCLKMGDPQYNFPGPYKVTKTDVDLGMIAPMQDTGKFTIYSPDPLDTNCQHPIVAWGNGTGVTDSDFTYDFLNSAVASYGIVVASSAENNTGSGAFHKARSNRFTPVNARRPQPLSRWIWSDFG